MSFFLDIILSFVAGALVVITIILTIINLNQMNYNIQAMLELKDRGLLIAEIIDHYIERTGKHLTESDPIIIDAEHNRFHFNYVETVGSTPIPFDIRAIAEDNKFYLQVDSANVEVFSSLPDYLVTDSIFTYYGLHRNLLDPVIIDSIRSLRTDLIFIEPAWSNDPDANITYPITFWRFLKNIFIIHAP